jgi:MFS family permease
VPGFVIEEYKLVLAWKKIIGNIMTKMSKHPLFQTLSELKGNPRACVLTEPLFGIPYSLFYPFFSVYMLALGVTDQGIGTIASVGLVAQIFTTLISGVIVDKFGRRLTLLINDLLAWSIPCLIWATAQNMKYFLIAAVINSLWRVSNTAWTCLMVEDAEERHLVHIWTWISIFSACAAFFTPLGGWFVGRFGLVPTMRGLLVFGFVVLTTKAIVTFIFTRETVRGQQRLEETRHQSLKNLLSEYGGVFKQLFHSKLLLSALSLMVIVNIYQTVSGSFWSVLFTGKLGFANSQISLFVALRSIIMALGFFLVGPRFKSLLNIRLPLWVGFSLFFVSQAMLVFMPPHSVFLMVISVMLEGLAASLVTPMTDSLMAVALESHERARISAVVYVLLILVTSPFGWIAGQLSAIDRSLPFALTMVLFVFGGGLVWLIDRNKSAIAPAKDR